jgi:hypothetical protein
MQTNLIKGVPKMTIKKSCAISVGLLANFGTDATAQRVQICISRPRLADIE